MPIGGAYRRFYHARSRPESSGCLDHQEGCKRFTEPTKFLGRRAFVSESVKQMRGEGMVEDS
jgi:hypothetical protein